MVQSVGGTPPVTPLPASSNVPLTSTDGVGVRLVGLAVSLKSIEAQTQIRGQIIAVKDDGNVRIKTERGDIDVQLPPRVRADVGQIVDISLPKGSPPTEGQLAPARTPSQNAPAPSPQSGTAPEPNADPAQTVPRVPVSDGSSGKPIKDIAQSPRPASTAPQGPEPDQLVQIKQLRAVEVQQIARSAPATLQKILLNAVQQMPLTVSLPDGALPTTPMQTLITLLKQAIPQTAQTSALTGSEAPAALHAGAVPPQIGAVPLLPISPTTDRAPPMLPQDTTLETLITQMTDVLAMPRSSPTVAARLEALITDMNTMALLPRLTAPVPTATTGAIAATPVFDVPAQALSTAGYSAQSQPFVVIGHTPQGHAVLQSLMMMDGKSPAFFVMQTAANAVPVGTTLTLRPVATLPAAAASTAPLPPLMQMFKNMSLTLVEDMQELLRALPPDIAAQVFGQVARPPVPGAQATPQQLGAAALFFLAAVRSGDLNSWLGERGVDALKRAGKTTLIERLSDTFGSLRRIQESSTGAEWRSFLLPLHIQQEVMPIRLHMRSEQGDSSREDPGKAARYVIEIDFDNMGAVQIDMLYHARTLDTILRTELPLSQGMMDVLSQKYSAAMSNVDHAGALIFQHGPKSWVTIDGGSEDVVKVLA